MKRLTGIGKENEAYFAPLLMGIKEDIGILRIGLIEDGMAAGTLAASVVEDRADILQLYVREDLRRRGNGKELLSAFLNMMADNGIKGVSAFYSEDEALNGLFLDTGFLVLPGDELLVLNVEELLGISRINRLRNLKFGDELCPLSALTGAQRMSLFELLHEADFSEEDLAVLSPDPTLSAVVVRNGRAEGALFAKKEGEQCLIELLLNGKNGNKRNPDLLLSRLTEFIIRDPLIKELCFHAIDAHIQSFVEMMVGDPSGVKRVERTKMATMIVSGSPLV